MKCIEALKQSESRIVDCLVTSLTANGILPTVEELTECHRLMKNYAFGFFICESKQNLIGKLISRLEKAGFETCFSPFYWCHAPVEAEDLETVNNASGEFKQKSETDIIIIAMKPKQVMAANNARGLDGVFDTLLASDKVFDYEVIETSVCYFDLDAWFASALPEQIKNLYPYIPEASRTKLIEYLITMCTKAGDTVLDPYCGSEFTEKAARELKRVFLGCPLDEQVEISTDAVKEDDQSSIDDWL